MWGWREELWAIYQPGGEVMKGKGVIYQVRAWKDGVPILKEFGSPDGVNEIALQAAREYAEKHGGFVNQKGIPRPSRQGWWIGHRQKKKIVKTEVQNYGSKKEKAK